MTLHDGTSSPGRVLTLRCPILAGVPPGGSQPCVDATALIAFGRPYHTYYHALAHSVLSVARELPLLHVPRFPFHDSSGFGFCCKTTGFSMFVRTDTVKALVFLYFFRPILYNQQFFNTFSDRYCKTNGFSILFRTGTVKPLAFQYFFRPIL